MKETLLLEELLELDELELEELEGLLRGLMLLALELPESAAEARPRIVEVVGSPKAPPMETSLS